jgi:DNA-binding PadR family transcriptional regulator
MTPSPRTDPLPPHWFQILLSLSGDSKHGLAILREVYDRTSGQIHLWPGMLYGTLKRMVDAGLVVEVAAPAEMTTLPGSPRFYELTARGRRRCAAEAERMERYVAVARARRLLRGR